MPQKALLYPEPSTPTKIESQRYLTIVQRRTHQVVEIRRPTHPPDLPHRTDAVSLAGIGTQRHLLDLAQAGSIVDVQDVVAKEKEEVFAEGVKRYAAERQRNSHIFCHPSLDVLYLDAVLSRQTAIGDTDRIRTPTNYLDVNKILAVVFDGRHLLPIKLPDLQIIRPKRQVHAIVAPGKRTLFA